MQIAIVLSLLALGIALFISEKISIDVVTLLLLVGLVVAGILTPDEAFAGLSSDVVVVMAAIFVLCGAVQDSGILNVVSAGLVRAAGKRSSLPWCHEPESEFDPEALSALWIVATVGSSVLDCTTRST